MDNPSGSYARLIGIYESDVKVDDKWVHCFLLTMETVEGHKFMSPVYVHPNYTETTRKVLSRLTPMVYAPGDDTVNLKKDTQTVEMTEVVAHTIVPENTTVQ